MNRRETLTLNNSLTLFKEGFLSIQDSWTALIPIKKYNFIVCLPLALCKEAPEKLGLSFIYSYSIATVVICYRIVSLPIPITSLSYVKSLFVVKQ